MVGIVVVSHSRALAQGAVDLARQMVHGALPDIAIAAGLDEQTLGTDAAQIKQAIEAVDDPAGVVVLLDLGSALLSTDLALELLDDAARNRVHVSPAPLVEGLVAAVVTAASGASAPEVVAEASAALAGKQAHLEPEHAAAPTTPVHVEADEIAAATGVFVVRNRHGLHARPAARLVAAARAFQADVYLTNLTAGTCPVPASSLSKVATLGTEEGHEIAVRAAGVDGNDALAAILALAARSFDEPEMTQPAPVSDVRRPVGASPGIAVGPVVHREMTTPLIPDVEPGDPTQQWRRLRDALDATRTDIDHVRATISQTNPSSDVGIFDAHLMLLDDSDLLVEIKRRIDAGDGAASAWRDGLTQLEGEFQRLRSPYLRARAADVRAVRNQVLRHLVGDAGVDTDSVGVGIVVAADLTPAEAADLDPTVVRGIVLADGSPTSHAAILARSKGIPMIVAAGAEVLGIASGTQVVVDASGGLLICDPSPAVLQDYERRIAEVDRDRATAQVASDLPAVTHDGVEISVAANVGSFQDAKAAALAHAAGAGLVRTELLFASRSEPPDVREQEAIYRAIVEAFEGKRVVFRTLDVGGDKPLQFVPRTAEQNPFLGVRGIRLSLRYPTLLTDQLRAICAVAGGSPIGVMFPMISTLDELHAATGLLDQACGGSRPAGLEIGVMVEVPALALKTATFASQVDFFSVGTNDLTQYVLAADRQNPALSALADPLDPGVLRLVCEVCRAAETATVSVCGEIGSDPLAVPLLIGLGVRSLSVAVPAIAEVKQAVRGIETSTTSELAAAALRCASGRDVRALLGGER